MPIVLNGSGPVTGVTSLNTTVSDTEIGYLDGVSSALQTQITAKMSDPGAWTAFTPTLAASTTAPTLGTGSTAAGRYIQIGKIVLVTAFFQFGTSSNAGSGTYFLTLPVTANSNWVNRACGSSWAYDFSANQVVTGTAHVSTTSRAQVLYSGTTNYTFTSGFPWAWASSDEIHFSIQYEAA